MDTIEHLNKFIQGTLTNKISWTIKNPTTFNWQTTLSDGTAVNVVLQKLTKDDKVDILFRVWNMKNRYSMLDFRSLSCEPTLKMLIENLYEVVSEKNLKDDILTDLLRNV